MRSPTYLSLNLGGGFTSSPANASLSRMVFVPPLPFYAVRIAWSWQVRHTPVVNDDKSCGTEGITHRNMGIALDLTLLPTTKLILVNKRGSLRACSAC